MTKTTLFLSFTFLFSSTASAMEVFPNEVMRMFFEHMSHKQRKSVARTCSMWNFLTATFKKSISEKFVKNAYCAKSQRNGFMSFLTGSFINNYKPHLHLYPNADKDNVHAELTNNLSSTYCCNDFMLLDQQACASNCQITKFSLWGDAAGITTKVQLDSLLKTISFDPRIVGLTVGLNNRTIAKNFFDTLCQFPQITHLSLFYYGNIELLTYNKTIDSLELGVGIKNLTERVCKCIHDCFIKFSEGFSLIRRLKILQCSDAFCNTIIHLIEHNKTLEEFDLRGDGISAHGALKIIDALQKNDTVTQVDFRGNRIDATFIEKYQDDKRLIFA